jgi:hypothetical protein
VRVADTVTVSAADVQVVTGVFILAAHAFGSTLGAVPGFGAAIEACGRLANAAPGDGMPEDPVTGVRQMAITHHELMLAYEDAGFDHSEAFVFTVNYAQATAQAAALRMFSG